MNEVLLSNEVIIYLVSETILFALLTLAAIALPALIAKWDYSSFDEGQLRLEKRSYLVMSIIYFVLILKSLLLVYFAYTLDRLALIIPGAMCAAGVIKANGYGNVLLALKIVLLFLSLFWISINRLDLSAREYPWHRIKSWLFAGMFLLFAAEYLLDLLYFTHISTVKPVTCCSVIFGQLDGANMLPFGLDTIRLAGLFYLLFLFIVLMHIGENDIGLLLANIAFLPVAYYGVVYLFGTYVYELPTHKCPFCMLQKEYHYVGYLLWGLLFLSVWSALDYVIMKLFFSEHLPRLKRLSLWLLIFFVTLNSLYILLYYIKTGAFL